MIFEQLKDFVEIISDSSINGLVVSGDSGLSKTKTVKEALKEMNVNYKYDKVVITTGGDLYKILYKNNDSILVLDESDCMLLKKSPFRTVLLSALEFGKNRRLAYMNKRDKEIESKKYPQSFNYTGKIIFITNLDEKSVDDAILSRTLSLSIVLSRDEILNEIFDKINEKHKNIKTEIKYEVHDFLMEYSGSAKRFDFREYEKIIMIRLKCPHKWRDYAVEMLKRKPRKTSGTDEANKPVQKLLQF